MSARRTETTDEEQETGEPRAGRRPPDGDDDAAYGETWVYESIVGALPGVDLSDRDAVLLQVAIFQVGVLVLAVAYDDWAAVPAGTAAVLVAGVGSVVMLRMGRLVRRAAVPPTYRRLLFGSSIEVVLAVLAFAALITHLFVFDPIRSSPTLLESLLGTEPAVPVVYLTLLVLWDLCYRIGTSWWAAVVALWRSLRFRFDAETARDLRRIDLLNVGFGLVQIALVPFVLHRPVLLLAVGGHVVAVTAVSLAAYLLLRVEESATGP